MSSPYEILFNRCHPITFGDMTLANINFSLNVFARCILSGKHFLIIFTLERYNIFASNWYSNQNLRTTKLELYMGRVSPIIDKIYL